MSNEKIEPISITALRADNYSPDGRTVIISLTTKYSAAERKYCVPVECLQDLIVDLLRLNAAASTTLIDTPIQPTFKFSSAEEENRALITG
jgi:hypothetical protein